MKILQLNRQEGKTRKILLRLLANPSDIMVTHNARERDRLRKEYPDLARQIFSFEERYNWRGLVRNNIHVDNLDLILPALFGGSIGLVTTTDG